MFIYHIAQFLQCKVTLIKIKADIAMCHPCVGVEPKSYVAIISDPGCQARLLLRNADSSIH